VWRIDNSARKSCGNRRFAQRLGALKFASRWSCCSFCLSTCRDLARLARPGEARATRGMRRNGILGLARAAIDWQNRMVTLGTTKNGDSRHGPNQLSMAFSRVVKRAGIEDFSLHDTRHIFASYQAMAGTPRTRPAALLEHKDGRITMRYSHLSDEYLREAVNRFNLSPESSLQMAPI